MRIFIGVILTLFTTAAFAQQWNPRPGWKDSYAVGGQCYCDSNFDHGIGGKIVSTPDGRKSVRQVCADIKRVLGTGSTSGRVPYNDVQCGNGPANNAADETGCPGRVDQGSSGCNKIGPKWNLEKVYGSSSAASNTTVRVSATQAIGDRVAVVGATSSIARAIYARTTLAPRIDCDPSGDGRWVCANFQNPTLADVDGTVTTPEPVVEVTPAPAPTPTPTPTVLDTTRFAVAERTIREARAQFQRLAGTSPVDCDPHGGQWVCGSFNNPTLADVEGTVTTPEPVVEVTPTPTPTTVTTDSTRRAVAARTISQARAALAALNVSGAVDCDPHGGQWVCGNFQNPTLADAGASPTTTVTTPTPTPTPPRDTRGLPSGSLFSRGDLLVEHFDSCPDPDDIHAAVATKMITDFYGLRNGSDYIVANGTCSQGRPRSNFVDRSPGIFNKLYGNAWFDVFSLNRVAASRTAMANKIAETLVQGRKVWIAEGGPADYSEDLIRQVERMNLGISLKNITIIQHSHGANERFTNPANLQYLIRTVRYVRIDNGNNGGNRTADLSERNPTQVNRFRNHSVWGDEWEVAFRLFNPTDRFDGSDAVETLWILGLDSGDVANWKEFGDKFLR